MQSKRKIKKTVNFSRVDLNEYNMTLGNNPSVSLGPPVCLDYTQAHDEEEEQQQHTLSIDEYESIRNGKRRKPNHYRMKISKVERLQILKHAGVSQKDIQSVERLKRGKECPFKWLQEKKNPTGWICAQKRFHSAFVKYMAMLEEHEDLIPDYLMIMDEDTYINVHDLEKYLITSDMSDKNDGYVPSSSETPVMFAGCRVRAPSHEIQFTFPFGGWGIYLSKGSLKKWLTPLDCDGNNGNKQSDHQELCLRYKTPFVNNATDTTQITIGEGRFFQNGMNLNQVFMRYIQEQQHYCLHGDWFFGYIANYLNMSRHVIPGTGQLPTVGYGGNRAKGFDDNEIGYNRLHTIMGSEQYGIPEGLCLYGNNGPPKYNEDGMEKEVHFYIPTNHLRPRHRKGWKRSQTCIYNTTICHYIKDPNDMKRLYTESENQRGFIYSFEDNT
ncbi:hypothetical protein CTEN210_14303 [Chaetoceros tenuissimus]|uniref:Fringe-like glycosyltransferase domain-containing protein n=1 Tax=Chaetoceros tenuissimus TaxID=426638 RepID=A0AAD3HBM4_9STRA|nr:hypothetical protein CTEN210_14303 [Chaetoceros tenuissimus]